MKVVVIGDEDTAALFRFAGAGEVIVADEDVGEKFDKVVEDGEVAIVLITERVADKIARKIEKVKLQRELPVIVEIPDKKGKAEGREDSVEKLIKRAVGVEV